MLLWKKYLQQIKNYIPVQIKATGKDTAFQSKQREYLDIH